MSCIAVLITQHITSDLKAATQLCSIFLYRNYILTKIHRSLYTRDEFLSKGEAKLSGDRPYSTA